MYVGVDVRDTSITIGFVNDRGVVSFHNSLQVDPEKDTEAAILDIIYVIKTMSETVPLELFNDRLLGIGIGIPDTLNKDDNNILVRGNADLKRTTHREIIERYFDTPIYIENHSTAEKLAAAELSAAKGKNAGVVAAALLCKYMK